MDHARLDGCLCYFGPLKFCSYYFGPLKFSNILVLVTHSRFKDYLGGLSFQQQGAWLFASPWCSPPSILKLAVCSPLVLSPIHFDVFSLQSLAVFGLLVDFFLSFLCSYFSTALLRVLFVLSLLFNLSVLFFVITLFILSIILMYFKH